MAFADYACITCPDCDSLALPTTQNDDCVVSYESEVCDIFIALTDATMPDFTDPAAIETALTAGDIARLTVIGDVPEPEQTVRTISKRRQVLGIKTFNLNYTVDDINDVNYTALRTLECGGTFRIAFATVGGHVYGVGDDGIKASVSKAHPLVLDRGEDAYERGEGAFQWKHNCSPERGIYGFGPLYVAPGP